MKVLSLFDGMSSGQIAFDRLGIKVDNYYASEIDKYAILVAKANYPNTIHVGDVTQLNPKDFKDIDIILAAPECQGFSFAGKQLAFDDPRSALFFEFIRLLQGIKPKYFLLENVPMKLEFLQIITEQVSSCYPDFQGDDLFSGVIKPISIDSALLSAQSRKRMYWTNITGVKQPEDKGIVLKHILEDEDLEEYAFDNSGNIPKVVDKNSVMVSTKTNQINPSKKANGLQPYMQDRIFHKEGKSHALTKSFASRTHVGEFNEEGRINMKYKCNATTTASQNYMRFENLSWRRLSCLEAERLQTVPDNYTASVKDSERFKMLGNGWTVDVICHILKNININNGYS